MYQDVTVGVVIPAYNEEKLIGRVIETMPDFVDRIIIVDDKSTDDTVAVVRRLEGVIGTRLQLIEHEKNQGVGGAVLTGYGAALREGLDIVAVMQGDAQTEPSELRDIIQPIVDGKADYTKGNRLFTGDAWNKIPHYRYIGNAFLSLFTKIAAGYWHVADSQSGFTAISRKALEVLSPRLGNIYKRYGFFNDLLVHLNVYNYAVTDVPISPIYDIGEVSGIKLRKVVPAMSLLLMRRFLWRIKEKYVIRDFHPLVFFYFMGATLFWAGFLIGIYESYYRIFHGFIIPAATVVLIALLIISGLQSLFFAMWFDMEYNKELK